MNNNDQTDEDRRNWIQYLLDLDIPTSLTSDQRLLLAILRVSVADYFGDDPVQQLSAALYFSDSWVYRMTLQVFGLPEDLLPQGIDLSDFRRKEMMNGKYELSPLRLETLVRQLTGNQVKIVLIMGLLTLPADARKVSLRTGISRQTVREALRQMTDLGLVVRGEIDGRAVWSLPDDVRRLVEEVWDERGS